MLYKVLYLKLYFIHKALTKKPFQIHPKSSRKDSENYRIVEVFWGSGVLSFKRSEDLGF